MNKITVGNIIGTYKVISLSSINKQKNKVFNCECIQCGKTCKMLSHIINKQLPCKNCGGALSEYSDTAYNFGYITYKADAKNNKRLFNLTYEEFKYFVSSPCYYCGRKNSFGIDRIYSTGGYYLTNCRSACAMCNRAKSNLTDSEFLSWINRLMMFRNTNDT